MGVMPCSRRGCDHILVTNDLGEYRICDECIRLLEDMLTADRDIRLDNPRAVKDAIDRFMETTADTLEFPDRRDLVKEFLAKIIDRRD